MTTLTQRRKLDKVESLIEGHWLNAWLDWGKSNMQRWARVDPQAGERHRILFEPLYQEWAAASQGGELPAFLSRGASLAKWWASAPDVWLWLWEAQAG